MASLGQRFDATQHDTTQAEFSDLPLGIYQFELETAEVAKTANGRGTILKTVPKVVAPAELAGRKLFGNNYNLENDNPVAQEIGQKQFASLCRAIGIDGVEDSDELLFRVFTAKIGMGKPSKDGQYAARPEIKRYYFPDEGNVPEPEIDAVQPPPAPKAANDNRRPAANDNAASKPAGGAAAGGTRRPWGNK
jgi:hypothetical protein